MQFYKPTFNASEFWIEGLNISGERQMQFSRKLILSRPYLERIPDQSSLAGENGDKYNCLAATRGKDYAFIYTNTGINILVKLGIISGEKVKASWCKPTDGSITEIDEFEAQRIRVFDPPGDTIEGNHWVLVLDY